MNKKSLVDILAKKTGLQKQEVTKVVNTLINTVTEEMTLNHKVSMRGFGIFYPIFQNERPVRSLKTGQELTLAPRYSIKFKPGTVVLQNLNQKKKETTY